MILSASPAAFGQTITASPSSVSMTAQTGGQSATTTLNLTASASAQFIIQPNPGVNWLSINPSSGTLSPTPTAITLTANPTGLATGTYFTLLQIAAGATGFQSVPVSFTVSTIGISPSSLNFSYQTGGQIPSAQTIALNGGFGTTFTAIPSTNWMQVAPTSGSLPSNLSVQLNSAVVSSLAAGTYEGSITVSPSVGNPVAVPVFLTVSAGIQVTINPTTLNFFNQIGGSNNVSQLTFTLSTTALQGVNFGLNPQVDPNPAGSQWLTVTPSSGIIPASGSLSITASVNVGTLPAGTYNGVIQLFAPNATPQNQTIQVRLTVGTSPLINVPGTPISFVYQIGTTPPVAQTLTPTSTGAAISYTTSFAPSSGGNWLTVTPASGVTPSPISLTANPAGLAPGTYTGTLTVTPVNAGNGPQQITVTLRVSNDPVITASANNLTFAYQTGQALPAPQSIRISSSTGAALSYSATTATSWISLSGQTTGSTEGTLVIQVNPAGQSAGTHNGSITITATNPSTGAVVLNSPLTIPVKFFVSSTPLLSASPVSLSFTAQVGGLTPAAQTLSLTDTSASAQLTFQVQPQTDNGGNWLLAGPVSGTTPNTLVISVVPALLSAGTYTGSIRVTATLPGGAAVGNSPLIIPVTLTMTQGTLSVTPLSLSFTQLAGGPAPAPKTLQIVTTGPATNYTVVYNNGIVAVTWLTATPTSGLTPGSVTVAVDGAQLSPGTYQGSIIVSAAGAAGSPIGIPVTFTVTAGAIAASPTSLTFSAPLSGSTPASQTIQVTAGAGALDFTASASTTAGGNWLAVTPFATTTPGTLTVSAYPAGLAAGIYNGAITITSPGAAGSPLTIPVTLNVGQTAVRGGVLSHIAAGGGWTTVISLINPGSTPISVTVNLKNDNGSALSLPLTTTLQGSTQPRNTPTVTATLNPSATLLISIGNQIANTTVGWVDVASSGPVAGFAIFRTSTNNLASEGTVPLQTQFTPKLVLPFDNTAGFVTGVALANLTTTGAVTATTYDPNGTLLGTQSIGVPANGHASFVLPDTIPQTAGKSGIVVFQGSGGNGLSGLGLRFSSVGTFTSVPTILAQ
jgi:hypothetical protein